MRGAGKNLLFACAVVIYLCAFTHNDGNGTGHTNVGASFTYEMAKDATRGSSDQDLTIWFGWLLENVPAIKSEKKYFADKPFEYTFTVPDQYKELFSNLDFKDSKKAAVMAESLGDRIWRVTSDDQKVRIITGYWSGAGVLIDKVRSYFLSHHLPELIAMSKSFLEEVGRRQDDVEQDNLTHTHRFRDLSLEAKYEFVRTIIRLSSTEQLQSVWPPSFLAQASMDTNDDESKSRKEIIDVLASHDASRSDDLQYLDQVKRMAHTRAAFQHHFLPDKYPPLFGASPASEQSLVANGERSIRFFCSGSKLEMITKLPWYSIRMNEGGRSFPIYSSVELLESQILLMERNQTPIQIQCGKEVFTVKSDPNAKKQALVRAPKDMKFDTNFQEPLRAVAPVAIVWKVNAPLIAAMVLKAKTLGYELVSTTPLNNPSEVIKGFLDEAEKANMIFPIGNSINMTSLDVGMTKSKMLKFVKKGSANQKPIELSVIIPVDGFAVAVKPEQISQLFADRRTNHRPQAYFQYFSCNSTDLVPATVRAFRLSHGNDAKALSEATDVPVVVASTDSFKASNNSQIEEHLKYPMAAMELASRGASAMAVLEKTRELGYPAASNILDSVYNRIDTERLHVEMKGSLGSDIYY
jgi:hypothetical protein